MGQIYRRAGSKYIWLDYPDEFGKRVRRSSGKESEIDAEQELALAEGRIARIVANKGRLSYKDAVVSFLKGLPTESTRACYTSSARTLDPFLSKFYLDEITTDHIKDYVRDRRSKAIMDSTIEQNLFFLSAVFRTEGVQPNPVVEFTRMKMLTVKHKPMSILSEAEEACLMSELREPLHKDLVLFALETGLRKEEQLTLLHNQVALEHREIRLRANQTKTRRPRIVPMTARAIEIYSAIRQARKKEQEDRGDGVLDTLNDWVFRRADGSRIAGTLYFFQLARNRAQLPDLRWHDLRHTFATRWLRATGDIYALAKILGHSDIKTTTIYLHAIADDLHTRMSQFDKFRGFTY